jgi:hypothetical protein
MGNGPEAVALVVQELNLMTFTFGEMGMFFFMLSQYAIGFGQP